MILFLSVFFYRFFEYSDFKKGLSWYMNNVTQIKETFSEDELKISRLKYAFSYAKNSVKQRHEMFLESIFTGDFSIYRDYYGKYAYLW